MKIMTFNLRADNLLDINNRWKKRDYLVYNVLRHYKCDLIGLQEVTEVMNKGVASHTKSYHMIGRGRTKRFFAERNPLLISHHYKIEKEETFWLSKTPNEPGSSIWYSLFPRICTMAQVEMEPGVRLRVYNTHLDCLLPQAREFGIKRIIEKIEADLEEEKLPFILMGDFNATPNSKVIKKLVSGEYSKQRLIAVQDADTSLYEGTTMGMFKGREKGMHIDYIFVSKEFKINDVKIVKYHQGGKYPSDHYPIVADISLN